ncbi:oligosaccharide flippase family protein [Streptococcus pluranimalium]|uniref:lipopolysaccharide biosynthesis protein n=1 Tax=Streptococcus pluranimalium TaxID=82348 RepID=UPI00292EF5D7|nr:oligosaccharide flippase family protein [Streptococcus pluranimalium]
MNTDRIKKILKNFGYVITSNLLTLIISSLVILVLPKVIGVNEYGYWQLYTFYLTYIGFFHFGWCDGIYLKFGGQIYEELDKSYFSSQISSFVIFQSLISLISIVLSLLMTDGSDILFIFIALSLNFVITNTRLLYIYTLQTTNRIKDASIITIADRFIYALLLVVLLISNHVSFRNMIIADNIGRLLSLIYAFIVCREITFIPNKKLIKVKDSWDNIKVGSNLMLANIASNLIIGVVRFAIQRGWDIATFGRVSLTLSLSNLVMTFINAVGVVVFPMLKRTHPDKLSKVYISMRLLLMLAMFTVLLAYYPIRLILENWLPAYKVSLEFMGIIFPMVIFEGKTSLLLNTYLKAMRQEKLIFKINFLSTLMSILVAFLTVWLLNSLYLSVCSIVILLALRSTILEYYLTELLSIKLRKDIILELVIVSIFILANIFVTINISFMIYAVTLAIYYVITLDKKNIGLLKSVKNL